MKWTDDELDYLKRWYGKVPAEVIATVSERSVYSIYHQARRLGLKSTLQRHKRNAG